MPNKLCSFIQNNPIHAIVSEADYDDVVDKIKLGSIYEITNFHASKNPGIYIIVPHETQLMFNNRTIFNELNEVYPPYPRYWFQFVDYFDLFGLKGDDTTLIGNKIKICIVSVFSFLITLVLMLFIYF